MNELLKKFVCNDIDDDDDEEYNDFVQAKLSDFTYGKAAQPCRGARLTHAEAADLDKLENVVVTLTSYRGSTDHSIDVSYLSNEALAEYTTWLTLYWHGYRIYEDGSIKKIREYADGGPEIVYSGKYIESQPIDPAIDSNKIIMKLITDCYAAEEKAKEDAKVAAKAERAKKKLEKEKADYERLKKKFK